MADPEVPPSPRKSRGWLVAAVLALALAGAGVFFWMQPSGTATATAGNTAIGYTLPLETFIVNLNAAGERGYLRVGIALGLSHTPARKEDVPIALVRDTILTVLSGLQPEKLTLPDGKRKLKEDILQALKARAPELGIEDVYFTEFLVQM